ncbi:hypothetical protein [Kineococcus sp. SYSU DK003]|uniref:hypothetical protein n=1 Tax=Kineococcus sp. SYSU DK003 TaxID=3383124 RepID=UPI003D7C8C31
MVQSTSTTITASTTIAALTSTSTPVAEAIGEVGRQQGQGRLCPGVLPDQLMQRRECQPIAKDDQFVLAADVVVAADAVLGHRQPRVRGSGQGVAPEVCEQSSDRQNAG